MVDRYGHGQRWSSGRHAHALARRGSARRRTACSCRRARKTARSPACAARAGQRKAGGEAGRGGAGPSGHHAHRVPVERGRGVVGWGEVRGTRGKCRGHGHGSALGPAHDHDRGHGLSCARGGGDAARIGASWAARERSLRYACTITKARRLQARSTCAATTRGDWFSPRAPRRHSIDSPASWL